MKTVEKYAPAVALSMVGVVLCFVLDEVFIGPRAVFSREHIRATVEYVGVLGVYFLLVQYFYSRRGSRGFWKHWPELIAINSLPLLLGLISWAVEKGPPEALYLALILVVFSAVGVAIASRLAPVHPTVDDSGAPKR